MSRRTSTPPSTRSPVSGTRRSITAVCLFLDEGVELCGEILSGDGRSVTVGLAASAHERIPLGKPFGFEVKDAWKQHRIAVVATSIDEQDGISTAQLVLSNRATFNAAPGSIQAALFNERAAFRLPVHRDSVESMSICSVSASAPATRAGTNTRPSVRGSRYSARLLDVSFDGVGVLVSKNTDAGLQGAENAHLELLTSVGKITVEGLICHRKELAQGAGALYGIAAGASRVASWRPEDERAMRLFVTEQQRMSLERLRRA
ncbi:MAG: hypothetical protein ACI80K_003843 [Paracoccaceae bacterium]|jgi:hypothetical protein